MEFGLLQSRHSRESAGLSGENSCALRRSPQDGLHTLRSSCAGLARASTSCFPAAKTCTRDKSPGAWRAGTRAGHDDEKESAAQFLQPNNFPRTALRASGNPGSLCVSQIGWCDATATGRPTLRIASKKSLGLSHSELKKIAVTLTAIATLSHTRSTRPGAA